LEWLQERVVGQIQADSLITFEVLRMAAREPNMPDGIKLLANIFAALCVVDGYGATVEGLRKVESARVSANKLTLIPCSLPEWPLL
jgi:hypothetical protein